MIEIETQAEYNSICSVAESVLVFTGRKGSHKAVDFCIFLWYDRKNEKTVNECTASIGKGCREE
jgi:hypothetical protein